MSQVRSVIESFDNSNEQSKNAREMVEHLGALAQAKADLYEKELLENLRTAGSEENKTLPVESIIFNEVYTRAFTSSSAQHIPDAVKGTLKKVVEGAKGGSAEKILDGVIGLASEALATFLGETEASTETKKWYWVAQEGYSIVRLDMRAWYLSVRATSVKEKVEKICAFVLTKSVVNVGAIGFNTFLNLYDRQLRQMNLADNDIEAALDRAAKIYERFKPKKEALRAKSADVVHITAPPGASTAE